jgi:hypothetical protein
MSCCGWCSVKADSCSVYHKGTEGYYTCPGRDCGAVGVVWGTGPYTADSCICKAARHSGAIGPNGGTFRVTMTGGQQSYAGSAANGVSSQPHGVYDLSIAIAAA